MAKQDVELKFSLIDGVSRGLAQIQQGVSGLGASLVKVNAAAELTGRAFGALGSIAGAFGDAVSGAASVEDALKRVSIITRATTQEQSALQQAVSDAVATTRFTAEEAAGALVLMAEDGFAASEAVKQLGTVLQFAQANAQSAAVAAQGLGAVLDTFGAPATQISALADALTATAVAAGTSTKALQEGLAGAGVAAEQAGLSINDTVAALGGLAQRGIEGGAAAKALNKILADSENPASKLGKALEAAGLAGKSFGEIVGILSNDASKAAPILASLGNKPAAALKALLTEGGGALQQFNAIIDQSAGASKAAADALNETFLGALTRLQNQLAEARNQFLTPLLAPISAEFEALSSKISTFVASEQFTALSRQFSEFVTTGVQALGDLIEKTDFQALATKISNFASGAADSFRSLIVVIDAMAASVRFVANAVDELGLVGDRLYVHFSDAEKATSRFNVANTKLGNNLDETTRKLRRVRETFADVTVEVPKAAKGADAFGNSLDRLGVSATGASDDLRKIPEAAKLTEVGVGNAAAAAAGAAQSIAQLEASLAAVRKQLEAAPVGSPEFVALSQQAAELEAKIKSARVAIDDAAGANERLANSSNNAANALRNQTGAADSAGSSAERLSDSNSQVSDSFGNIGNKSSEAAISLGNLTEEFVRNALAVAGTAKSGKDYVDSLNRTIAASADEEKRIKDRIAFLDRQNAALSEEGKLRAEIERHYGTSSTLVGVLIEKERQFREEKKKTNDEAQRGLDIEKERAGVAGALGTGRPNADQGAATAAGKGAGDQGGGKGAVVNITVQGLPNDRDTWRGIVRDLIEPELRNLRALGK